MGMYQNIGRFLKNLQTHPPAPGRALNSRGTARNWIDFMERLELMLGPFDHLATAEYWPIFDAQAFPGFDPLRDDLVPASETQDVFIDNGELVLDGTAGLRSLYTRIRGEYVPGTMAIAGIRARVPTPESGVYAYGYGDRNGHRMEMRIENGAAKTRLVSGGVTLYEQDRANWLDPLDGSGPSALDLSLTEIAAGTLRILFGHYGGLTVGFTLALPDRFGDRLVLFDRTESPAGITIAQPNLPVFAEADGGDIRIGGRQFGIMGRYQGQFRKTSTRKQIVSSVGDTAWRPIVSIRVKNDEERWRGIPVKFGSTNVAAVDDAEWALFIDPVLTASGSALVDGDWTGFEDIAADATALEMNNTADAMTGGYRAWTDGVAGGQGASSGQDEDVLPDLPLPSGAILTLAARADSGTTTVRAILRALEKF